ncbi:TPA: PBP1A family penicillin-binding protein [Candidatus Nomurabacteria bacterium]|nr:MAG: 1A family penicillin-binding protein [Parcubacteria bacterium RAAC4_OD1_1]HCY26199.1 PBP1A family penicillin-binding protein [Candidatus Nomurabacteria bacterium]
MKKVKKFFKKNNHKIKNLILICLGAGIFLTGILIIWISTLNLPDFKSFTERKVQSSTKIYDRTGENLLYDVHQDIRRTIIPYEEMGTNIKNATVAIEDREFYNHKGIRITSIIRATIWAKLTGKKIQGGSTITQQLIKNTLLTPEVSISRKIKEWILAFKLEKIMSKEEILALYLNEAPYGGNIYGIKEASRAFFGKDPKDMTLAESAYMAAIPNGPTFYSPYGKNKDKLEARKNLVLSKMLELTFISEEEYNSAINEKVEFQPERFSKITAPHFVFFIKDYLEKKYGSNALTEGGLKVTTTIDYNLQLKTEQITNEKALENEKNWGGKNAAVVVIDPKTGQILSMVGSRNYFDKEIDGNFNVATAERQPGSSFKPFIYALAFEKGYTDETVLFDVNTEFNPSCSETGNDTKDTCYSPKNYDDGHRGPMTLRNALAQSINVIAVKMLYLVGIKDSIKLAHDMGITTLNDPDRYGLSLVIGGGETKLLDMVSAYGVFATGGVRHPHQGILSVEDNSGNILEEFEDKSYNVLKPNSTKILSSILKDNIARTPTFGSNSTLVIPGRDVAVKTGTTNDNKDAWTIGYTPSVVVGVWVGNNDNVSMKKGGAALAGPIWNGVMSYALKDLPNEKFEEPDPIDKNIPPILRGFWQGGETFIIDTVSGGLATEYTPEKTKKEIPLTNVHSILYWLDKKNPLEKTSEKTDDPQFRNWEYSVLKWWGENYYKYNIITNTNIPKYYDNVHTEETRPSFDVVGISNENYKKDGVLYLTIIPKSINPIKKFDIYINNAYVETLKTDPYNLSVNINDIYGYQTENILRIVSYDNMDNMFENSYTFYTES